MQVVKRLLICSILLLGAAIVLKAETSITDLADIFGKYGDDETEVPIKIKELRAAVWYYQNYWILLESVKQKDVLIQHYKDAVDQDVREMEKQDKALDVYKIATPILAGTTAVFAVLWIIETFVPEHK